MEHGAILRPGCFSYSFIVTSHLVMAFRAHSLDRRAYRYKRRVPPKDCKLSDGGHYSTTWKDLRVICIRHYEPESS